MLFLHINSFSYSSRSSKIFCSLKAVEKLYSSRGGKW